MIEKGQGNRKRLMVKWLFHGFLFAMLPAFACLSGRMTLPRLISSCRFIALAAVLPVFSDISLLIRESISYNMLI
jgi:threonine/homoserine efflux transporter RhtA